MVSQNRSDVALLYRRAGFGLRSDELDRLSTGSYEAAVDGLIAGLGGAADPGSANIPEPTLTLPARPKKGDLAALKAFNKAITADTQSLQAWWMNKMITTSTPLRERLTLFWHGHFATAVSKVRYPKLMYLQNQLFRTAGSGSFETLMQAVAKDGAMMIWLDTITDKKAHPNENFGREMMELFTLGLGNYTQDDVVAAAEGFTGWTYNTTADRYVFQRAQHDYATKTYLGQTGDWNGNDIVSIALAHPASPRFVLSKLWSHFAYPVSPAEQVVTDLLDAYGTGMSVSAALKAIFLHPDFRSDTTRTGLVKQPVEYLAGAARTLGLDSTLQPLSSSGTTQGTAGAGTAGGKTKVKPVALSALATTLGQTLFDPPNVGGWGQNTYWLDTVTALRRFEIALILAERGDISPVSSVPSAERLDAAANFLGVDGWGLTTRSALAQVADRPSELVALALSSPEYVIA